MEAGGAGAHAGATSSSAQQAAKKGRRGKKHGDEDEASKKRRCISSACVPCRKRKSKVRGGAGTCTHCVDTDTHPFVC